MLRIGLVLVVLIGFYSSKAQRLMKAPLTVCYASGKNEFTTVGPSAEYLRYKARKGSARTQSANIEVTYEGFTQEARDAFQEAVDIWESILVTPVKIRIRARWTPLATGVLGSAGPGQYVTNFGGAPKFGVWYPIALAEKITGKEINDPADFDIEAAFNSSNNAWHFGLTGSNPPAGKYDMVSIVLHEIGHGLGITHAYDVSGSVAYIPTYFEGKPVAYETFIQSGTGLNYVYSFTPPSSQLKSVITSQNLIYSSYMVRAVNANSNAVLYAPQSYVSGSSIAHLDESTYPAGNINSLMTPQIGAAERILDPGPITKAILKDIGWTNTKLEHAPLKDTENASGPFHAIVKVASDNGYDHNSVALVYYVTGDPGEAGTSLPMTATANPDEYAADIPGGNQDYSYRIYVVDNDGRYFYNVPELVTPGTAPLRDKIHFHAGPDVTPPVITHETKAFATNVDNFTIEASVTDNIGIDNVKIQWKLNNTAQSDKMMTLLAGTESTYEVVIDKSIFQIGDTIKYRIRAEDSSLAGNLAFNPSPTDFNEVIVTGLSETQKSYKNNFNDLSGTDFFGNGFSIKAGGSFDGHIQSTSPYPAAGVSVGHTDLIYNLKIPIRVASKDASLKFDEIALVEPGENGANWPDPNFFDYVVVEGSTDGVTWTAIADGYDCRYNNDWVTVWNSGFSGDNSTGAGIPSLYRPHEFDLLDKFHAGDEVAIRFRLFSDQFSAGWGWAIDNLRIQIDETPPTIRHQHYDFVVDTTKAITLKMKINDLHGLKQVFVDYNVNGGTTTAGEIIVNPASDMYSSRIDLLTLGVKGGDEFQYKIRALDSAGNVGSYPETGFISTAIISMTSSVDFVESDLATESPDLTGNFFDVTSGRMNSRHPYDAGLGIDGRSDFSFLTRKPVKVSTTNSKIYYTDIALVEYTGGGVKDYVVVEASKDGTNWHQLTQTYAANAVTSWKSIYDAGGAPTSQTPLLSHQFDITTDGTFKPGDLLLIRFRLHSDTLKSGWGWMIDEISIQGSVTGLEPQYGTGSVVCAWPNPIVGSSLYLKLALPSAADVDVEILDTEGRVISTDQFSAPPGDFQREYDVNTWSHGLYLVRVKSVFGTSVMKLIKLK
jgi:hypothetical protein